MCEWRHRATRSVSKCRSRTAFRAPYPWGVHMAEFLRSAILVRQTARVHPATPPPPRAPPLLYPFSLHLPTRSPCILPPVLPASHLVVPVDLVRVPLQRPPHVGTH